MTCDYPPTLKTLPHLIYLQRTECFFLPPHSSTKLLLPITNYLLLPTWLAAMSICSPSIFRDGMYSRSGGSVGCRYAIFM